MTSLPPPPPHAEIVARLGLAGLVEGHSTRTRLVLGSLGLIVLIAVLYFVFGGRSPTQYVTVAVTRGPLTVTVSATGTLAPRNQVDVGAEISGRIDEILVDFNDHVTKGQVLARLNTDQLMALLSQARASLASSLAQAQQARATLAEDAVKRSRIAALVKINAASRQDLDTATANWLRARAGVELADSQVALNRAQVAADETSLGKATIRAPIDGIVLDRKIEAGQTVVAAMQTPVLFTLASDLSQMELDVDIDEADVGSVHSGQTASFSVDAYPSRKFTANLVSLHSAPKTVQGVVTYQGVLLVKNTGGLLKPGMTATAEIRAAQVKNALLVANGALRFTPDPATAGTAPPLRTGPGLGRVWVVNGSNLEPRDLKLGASNGQFTQVISGSLNEGERVVVNSKS